MTPKRLSATLGVGLMMFSGAGLALAHVPRATNAAPPQRIAASYSTVALTAASLQTAPNGGASLMLTFNGAIPKFTTSGENTANIELTFTDATLTPGLHIAPAGAIKSVTFSAAATGFTVHIALTGANALGINREGNKLEILVAGVAAPPSAYATPRPAGAPAPPITSQHVEVVPLKYADVSEVAGIFSDHQGVAPRDRFVARRSVFGLPNASYGGSSYNSPVNLPEPQPTTPPAQGERVSANLAVDRRLNAAVLSGSAQTIETLRSAIEKIDVPAPAVQLDCDVVELTSTGAQDLGIDYSTSGAFASAFLAASNTSSPFESVSFQSRVFAEIKNGQGRLLSSPRVVSKDGMPVTLIDGDAVPVISSQIINGPPVIVQENVSYVNVGVHVQVQPRVNADGMITSHIFTEFSNVTARKNGPEGSVPQVTLRQTSTTATAADGQAFVIGGYLHTTETNNTVRMPVLGHLPLIGWLFRVRHQSSSSTNLYIIITPHVLK